MDVKQRKRYSDIIELFIVLAFIFMIITIYVPIAIWEEEEEYSNISHFRMETISDVEYFYNQLTDSYELDGEWAISVVNAVRDSLTADSTYLAERTMILNGKPVTVNIPEGYDIAFDTTFGFNRTRKDTIQDTTITVIVFDESIDREDTIYVQKRQLAVIRENPSFRKIVGEIPEIRYEVVNYYDSYMPKLSMLKCPVTSEPYQLAIEDNKFRVASPIDQVYKESRYAIFSFKASNHGYIDNGSKSWD